MTEANEVNSKSGFKPDPQSIEKKDFNGNKIQKEAKVVSEKKYKTSLEFQEKTLPTRTRDMTVSRSCRYRLSVPAMLWATVFVLLLARGVNSARYDSSRVTRSPKYDQGVDAQGRLITPSIQETYNLMQFIREFIQRQQQRAKEQQVDGNGEDLTSNQIDWRKIPLPMLYQIRAILSEQGSKEDKRGSYMSLCHFKICNLGKRVLTV